MSTSPAPKKRRHAYDYMIERWPDAHSLRFEGTCHNCKKMSLYSAVTPEDEKVAHYPAYKDKGNEPCGFFCVNCRWSNAGSRPVESDELENAE